MVRGELTIGTDIEQTAGSVIRSSTEGITIGEELNGVDVRVVGGEGLHALLLANIPQLGERIAGAGDELVVVERVDAQAHDIAKMIGEFVYLGSRFQIP